MYQSFPGGAEPPEAAAQQAAAAPPSIIRAARVMYVGAVASLIGIIIELLARHSLRTYIADHVTRNGKKLTAAQVTTTYHAELGVLVIVGLIGIGLWIWMARSSLAGKGWARITSTVFFAIDTISLIVGLSGSALSAGGATRFYGIVVWVIGLAAIILLWQRASSSYFKGAPR
ncbi:MAG: hypothetical protein ABSA02_30730 [Trebonia sp.]|jgi:hypothetical protein